MSGSENCLSNNQQLRPDPPSVKAEWQIEVKKKKKRKGDGAQGG